MNETSLRERNKREKLHRIKAAAAALFAEKGFDSATTRMIAEKAGVALATLFLYATDKRDLLFLVCNDNLERLNSDAFSDIATQTPPIEQLTLCFRHFFIFFGRDRSMSRDLLRELTFYSTGLQSQKFQHIRQQNIRAIETIITDAQSNGHIAEEHDSAIVAQMIFYLLAAEIRKWLSLPDAPPEAGVQSLRKMLEILFNGLHSN